ncbi:MAG: AbrB/MazE/SpoVT family DNA-binding domain-containing protein [Clostridium sp.]|uniref:AbrB/MazE/SpoVT family DNA-binding domain-containing protein n=1 Tax=Clostridium sp. TaxID=1506 RepID=UPI00290AB150|nr:AbrB/MazE/SpoVT family DNA-binding domain-containing protein [Clostridium sp.]MDU4939628.1 AbrB/MazE/SpoVT family DNA-binding domain-containing protein [Clostridium sp.]
MEKIKAVTFNKGGAGGSSGRIIIPKEFLLAMGVTKDNPNVKLTYKDGKIIIEPID